ncbi:hypothetical protein CLROS_044400 [Clostridium felsineum]|uniref:Uncharacterized protein n=1 Tax=Clostridium felsineum TaxID=36839 RepID=A0A1S8L3N5_9CLOT|nr:hypothetical protein CLROS_044400 [Clostridium felsineum]URZ09662.1 hypothetical protein CROST_003450 [Clostridium felsineum]
MHDNKVLQGNRIGYIIKVNKNIVGFDGNQKKINVNKK